MTTSLLQFLFPSFLNYSIYTLLAYDEEGYPVDEDDWDEGFEDDLDEDDDDDDSYEFSDEDEDDEPEWE